MEKRGCCADDDQRRSPQTRNSARRNANSVYDIDTSALVAGYDIVAEGNACSICLEKYELDQNIEVIDCGHYYHKSCLTDWKRQRAKENKTLSCPDCRAGDL